MSKRKKAKQKLKICGKMLSNLVEKKTGIIILLIFFYIARRCVFWAANTTSPAVLAYVGGIFGFLSIFVLLVFICQLFRDYAIIKFKFKDIFL